MRSTSRISAGWSWLAGLGVVAALLAVVLLDAGSPASAGTEPDAVFHATALLPGDVILGSVQVPAPPVAVVPFLRSDRIVESCPSCAGGDPMLAAALRLTVRAPDGSRWEGSFDDLRDGITLPGGPIPVGVSRRYDLGLVLPASATTGLSDRNVDARLSWGGVDNSGTTITAVEGETFTKDGSLAGSGRGALPFTGGYVEALTVAGLALLAGGVLVLGAGKFGRRSSVGQSSGRLGRYLGSGSRP